MKFAVITILFLPYFFQIAIASPLPCTVWQTQVTAYPTPPFKNKNGTLIVKKETKEHCRPKFPKAEKWQTQFHDNFLSGWPLQEEKFKSWTQAEKEILLEFLSKQPKVFRDLSDIKFLRGIKSKYRSNPGATVKRLNAIALYDEFFASDEKSQIISHEISHIYIHEINKLKLLELVTAMGWRENPTTGKLIFLDSAPRIKPDSEDDFNEDIANTFEVYLHNSKQLIL